MALLFCQLAQLKSLLEVCMGLASCKALLKHLGISETPKKSTLAYANENRPWELYQTVFNQLLEKCEAEVAAQDGRKKFRFKNKLVSLDGSIIDLSASMLNCIYCWIITVTWPSFAVVTSRASFCRVTKKESHPQVAPDRTPDRVYWSVEKRNWPGTA